MANILFFLLALFCFFFGFHCLIHGCFEVGSFDFLCNSWVPAVKCPETVEDRYISGGISLHVKGGVCLGPIACVSVVRYAFM